MQWGLVQTLKELGGDHGAETRELSKRLLARFQNTAFADAAAAEANRLASADLHDAVHGKPQSDAIMYTQGAMDRFAQLPRQPVGEIVMEIATLGQSGLPTNDPDTR